MNTTPVRGRELRPTPPAAELTLDDWRTVAALPVDVHASVALIARRLGVGNTTAWRRLNRLRSLKAVRTVAVVDRNRLGRPVHARVSGALVYKPGAFEAFERDAVTDQGVVHAALVSAPADFILTTAHPDLARSVAWYETFCERPYVRNCQRATIAVKFERPMSNGSLLAPEAIRTRLARP